MGSYLTKLKITLAAVVASQLLAAPAFAADWLSLQGPLTLFESHSKAGFPMRARRWRWQARLAPKLKSSGLSFLGMDLSGRVWAAACFYATRRFARASIIVTT